MIKNNSPWIAQLGRTRPVAQLTNDGEADVVIVGGGIAGISTAYYILKNTEKNIILVDAGLIAHGATGHNAGQLAAYFERPFSEIVEEFGLELAAKGQSSVESAWVLIDEIIAETQLKTPLWQFTGYAAGRDIEEVIVHLKNNAYRAEAGMKPDMIMLAEESAEIKKIPEIYKDFYTLLPHKDILALIESHDERYIAALPSRKGCMNSALFCEELVNFLLTKYSGRIVLSEQMPVNQITLYEGRAELQTEQGVRIMTPTVVLCTNGFERIKIVNTFGADIDTKFHHLVRGSVGYMAGYLEEFDKPPTAISYLPEAQKGHGSFESDPYFYLTRRPFDGEEKERHNLVCVGGPEALMDDTNNYSKEHPYPNEAQNQIDKFLHRTYAHAPEGSIDYRFHWHGLMGYTPNGIRCIGPEPRNSVLLYNLGCNGVGLLHSIYGGMRVSQFVRGDKMEASIFDPQNKY